MKVTTNWWRISIALHGGTFSGRYRMQCKQMWTFLEVFISGNKFDVFSTATRLIFS